VLRWALYEAGQQATRQTSPDHEYFLQVRERTDHKSAVLSVARKLCRRAFHILRELGEQALAPVDVDAHVEEAMHCRLTSRSPCAPARRHIDVCDRLPHKSRRRDRSDLGDLHRPSGRKQQTAGNQHPIDHLVAGPRVRSPR
jgi:hypothetical protein